MTPIHITKSFFIFLREALLALAIGILVPLISSYLVVIIHPQPEHSAFESADFNHNEKQLKHLQTVQSKLEKLELALIASPDPVDKSRLAKVRNDLDATGQEYEQCSLIQDKEREQSEQNYKNAYNAYAKVYFYVALAIGLLSLALSIMSPLMALSVGFLVGGLSSLTIGYIKYWDQLSIALKLSSLLFALILMIAMSCYFFYSKKADLDRY